MRSIWPRVVLGVALLVTAGLLKFVGVPLACRLPEGFTSSQRLAGEYRTLDPATFDLGAPTTVEAERDTTVVRTEGPTAIVESTTVLDLPSGALKSTYHYAVDRDDFSQSRAPSGTSVHDQHGAMVISRPLGAGTDSFSVYNPVIDKTQRMTFTGAGEVHGREAYGFSGTATGIVADPQLVAPYRSAIAQMAKTGDGTTIPKLLLEMIVADLPPRYAAGLATILPGLPNEVPIRFTVTDTTSLMVDKQLGAPITLAADQTTILNVFVDFTLVPVLPLSRVSLQSTDESAAESAHYMAANGRKLTIFGTYLPIAVTLSAIAVLTITFAQGLPTRRRTRRSPADMTITDQDHSRSHPVHPEPEPDELSRQ
ncbi:porin PorA family protein [Nocardia xishanensis]